MKGTIPIFYDHSSQKSILTFWGERDCRANGPQSIMSLAKESDLKEITFVSKNFSTFIEAWKATKERGIKLIFGVEIILCDDASVRAPESVYNEHKVIIFAKNSDGYNDLLKVYSECHMNIGNKYYHQRFDNKQLEKLWTPNLYLSIPFFDGFISKNLLAFCSNIMPDFSFCGDNICIFQEIDSRHPHADIITAGIAKCKFSAGEVYPAKTIYYKNYNDIRAYMVYRAIQERSSFSCPNIEFFCSETFCYENWRGLIS